MRLVIFGAGQVGLTTAATFAYLGHNVTCVDVDQAKVALLRAGRLPLFEPGLDELVAAGGERLNFSDVTDAPVADAEVVFIAVGTPSLPDGSPDLRFVRAAATAIGEKLGEGLTIVVNKSTVPIGTGNWVENVLREAAAPGRRYAVASNPEFLRAGTAVHDSLYPDRIVIGCDGGVAGTVQRLYRPILEQTFEAPPSTPRPPALRAVPLVHTLLPSAELMKYAANAFLALKISFINELAELSERVGADIREVAAGIGLDPRIGPEFLQAGIGWGGSCLGKDTAALVATGAERDVDMRIVCAARGVNERQPRRIVEKLLVQLESLDGRTIGLLGISFKPNTDDIRDAPSLELASLLLGFGARVRVHDPVAMERARVRRADLALEFCASAHEVAIGADAIVLVTEWPQYRDIEWRRLAKVACAPLLVVDARNALNGDDIRSAGLRYVGVGY